MGDFVQVRIYDAEGRLTLEDSRELPVSFGRGGSANCVVDDGLKQVSRLHAVVSSQGGALVLTDSSVNGTSYDGRLFKDGAVAIRDQDEFRIRDFRVEVKRVAQQQKRPVAFNAVFIGRSREETIPVGPTALLLRLDGKKPRVHYVEPRDPDSTLSKYPDALALISVRDNLGIIATAPLGVTHGLTVNRGKAPGGVQPLRLHDVVAIGSLRIEILHDKHQAIRCKNPGCRLLNPYDPRENCRYCGHRLVEGETRFVAS